MKINIFFTMLIIVLPILSSCKHKSEVLDSVPVIVEVTPTADTLHVGDTLWLSTKFCSKVVTLLRKQDIQLAKASIDARFGVIEYGKTTYEPFFTHLEQGDSFHWRYQTIECSNDTCRYRVGYPLRKSGNFYIAYRDVAPVKGLMDGVYWLKDNASVNMDSVLNLGVVYTFLPDKSDWSQLLEQKFQPNNLYKKYPFVVVE